MPPTITSAGGPWTFSSASNDPRTITMTAGRAYVAMIAKNTGTGTRSFSCADDASNTWGNYAESAGTNVNRAATTSTICTTGGSVTVTLSVSGGTTSGTWQIFEVTPASGTLSVGGTSFFDDASTTTSHQCAASSGFSPAADSAVFGLGAGTTGASFGTPTASGSFSLQSGSSNVFAVFTQETSSLLTNETIPWTSSVSRQCRGAAVYVTETPAAGGQPFRKRWGGIPGNAYTRRGTF